MHGVVAGSSRESVAAGAELLRAGGTAVDAAIAAAFATSAGDGAITSLAGGGALIVRQADDGAVEVCDFFANAPGLGGRRFADGGSLPALDFHAVEVDFGATRQPFHIGRGAAAVPGAIPGLVAAWRRWGTLPLATVLGPAVRCLREGVPLGEFHAHCIGLLTSILGSSPLGRERFLDADGHARPAGSLFVNPSLADTLERLGREEPERFYETELAPRIADDFGEERGGWITAEDLRRWRPEFRAPIEFRHGDSRVFSNPAPSVGGRFIELTLGLFDELGLPLSTEEPERHLRVTAALRAVSELRDEVPDLLERSDAPRLLRRRAREILEGVAGAPPGGAGETSLGNTVHISVVDAVGNAAGVTISHGEGNGHEIDRTGILMNNFLGEADLFPRGFHRFTPGERLHTMMAPGIVVGDDGALFVVGSGGSNRIRTALSQVISALAREGIDPQAAVERPRIHFEGGVLSAETFGLPGGARDLDPARRLASRCDLFDAPSLFFGGVNVACRLADGTVTGAADLRRNGTVSIV